MAKTKAEKAAAKAAKKQAKGEASTGSGGKLMAILSPVILGSAAFATVFMLPTPEPALGDQMPPAIETKEQSESIQIGIPQDLGVIELSEITVSIRNKKQVLRIGIALEVPYETLETIDPDDPRLRDAFMGYLRAIDVAQLEDAAFMAQLRAHLLRRSRLVLDTDTVHSVLITEFLVR